MYVAIQIYRHRHLQARARASERVPAVGSRKPRARRCTSALMDMCGGESMLF